MSRPFGPRESLACEVCGSDFDVLPCYAKRIKTCSPECKAELPRLRAAARRSATVATLPVLPDRTPRSITSAPRVQQQCSICEASYLIAPGVADAYTTCSRACSTIRRNNLGKGNTDFTCKHCGNAFSVSASHLKGQRTGDYCSNGCRIAGLNALPRKPPETAKCRICGQDFRCPSSFKKPDADGKTRGVYCSRACMWTDDDYRKRRAVKHSPTRLERWLFTVLDEKAIAYEKFATVGRYVPDSILTDYQVIIEVDGTVWHRTRIAYDQQRDIDLAAAGYIVLHFTDRELTGIKKARQILGAAIDEIVAGRAVYRPSPLYGVAAAAPDQVISIA